MYTYMYTSIYSCTNTLESNWTEWPPQRWCIRIHTNILVDVNIYIYTYIPIPIYSDTKHTKMWVDKMVNARDSTYVCTQKFTYICLCIYMYIYIYKHIYTYECVHKHTCPHM